MIRINIWKHWFYQGPYVPSGVLYGEGPSSCHWLIPGYEHNFDNFGVIDLYQKDIK